MNVRICRTVYWDGEMVNDHTLPGSFDTVAAARMYAQYVRAYVTSTADADVYAYTVHAHGQAHHVREVYAYENTEKENDNV